MGLIGKTAQTPWRGNKIERVNSFGGWREVTGVALGDVMCFLWGKIEIVR